MKWKSSHLKLILEAQKKDKKPKKLGYQQGHSDHRHTVGIFSTNKTWKHWAMSNLQKLK